MKKNLKETSNTKDDNKWEEIAKAVAEYAAKSHKNENKQNQSNGRPPKINFKKEYKPEMTWNALIKRLIPSKYKEETTYSKVSRRKIGTFTGINKSLGISAIPIGPGEKIIKNSVNLCIIWDSSFKLETINKIKDELLQTLQKLDFFTLIKVDNTNDKIKLFNIDLKSKKITPFSLNKNKIKTSELNFELDELFKNNFENIDINTSLQDTIKFLTHNKPNVILLANSNFSKNTKELTAYRIVGRQRFGIITSNKEEYIKFIKIMGDLKRLTYIC